MKLARRVVSGLRALIWRSQIERDLDDELRAYLDKSIEAKMAAGLPRRRCHARGSGGNGQRRSHQRSRARRWMGNAP